MKVHEISVHPQTIVTVTAAVVASYTTQHLVETGRGMEASKLIAATKTKEGMEKMKQDNDAANMEISKQIEALKSEFRRSRTT